MHFPSSTSLALLPPPLFWYGRWPLTLGSTFMYRCPIKLPQLRRYSDIQPWLSKAKGTSASAAATARGITTVTPGNPAPPIRPPMARGYMRIHQQPHLHLAAADRTSALLQLTEGVVGGWWAWRWAGARIHEGKRSISSSCQ